MSLYCNIEDLTTESDVEQKFIIKFLNEEYPQGCSYSSMDILTKHRIKSHIIGKTNPKQHYPDYIITINGLPVIVIEAKKPGVNVYDAFSEARMYANELNSKHPHGINPCKKIIASNGEKTIAGYCDQDKPTIDVDFEDMKVGSIKFTELLDFASKKAMISFHKDLLKQIRGDSKFFRPVGQIGGRNAQNSELQENSFGRTISLDYNHILIPESEEEYKMIVENAYVESKKREQHVEPILKTIRAIKLPSIDDYTTLISSQDTKPFFNGVEGYVDKKDKRHSLILLVGSVGSGKTTFIRYLKNIAVDKQLDLKNAINWIIINMNPAPISRESIYTWLTEAAIDKIIEQYPECNFGNKDFLAGLYADKIKEFENGVGGYLRQNKVEYDKELYQVVKDSITNKDFTLKCLLRYIRKNKKQEGIVVLDNVDKGSIQDQLLMFQVAEWFRNQYECLIVLPLRDTTYNMHKSVPPLDTVIKALVFRIDPPDLLTVLQYRLRYIYRIEKKDFEATNYILENGMKVILKENEHLEYFKYILNSIRQDELIKKIFYSITGRDIRSGIELFIDFCKSGHISARDLFSIRATGGEYAISNFSMMNAILRANRVFYSDMESKIKNLFSSEYSDDWVDPFIRVDILKWLDNMKNMSGASGVKGFHKAEELIKDLLILGHDEKVIVREIVVLIKNKLIISESQSDEFNGADLIRISPHGMLHIYLLNNITYLAACSEDVLYKNLDITKKISNRITDKSGSRHLSRACVIYNVEDMLNYLKDYRDNYLSTPKEVMESYYFDIYNLEECFNALDKMKSNSKVTLDIEEKKRLYPEGTEQECIVTAIKEFGLFVSIDFEQDGFIPKGKISNYNPEDYSITDIILGRVIRYSVEHRNVELGFIEKRL
ncbi:MAG TPA: hypothetical protein DCP90_08455 [Clostridiales bacterium]|nr:MAG: hypothetical protein A2Y22_08305 [Clostridiales bacterium GWD2_32_59]HAN10624.1 hypothetical protein [Clostridiales bacterium]